MEFVAGPHERWAEPAKGLHDTEQAGDDTLQSASQMRAGCQDETASRPAGWPRSSRRPDPGPGVLRAGEPPHRAADRRGVSDNAGVSETKPRDAWVELIPADELGVRMAANPSARSLYDFGFVANMARLMRTHPRIAATWGAHYLSVMDEGGALTRPEKEMVAAVAAAAQDCHY